MAFSSFVHLDFYQIIFFKRKNSVCGRRKLYASDPAQLHFADKEPETQKALDFTHGLYVSLFSIKRAF